MKSLCISFCVVFFLVGVLCETTLHGASGDLTVLAEVNGEPICENLLYERIRGIHRNKSSVPPEGVVGSFDILRLVEKMIDELLIIEEARRVELDKADGFIKRMNSFVTAQSVLRLREEEVIDKIHIGDKAVLNYFSEHYKRKAQGVEEIPGQLRRGIEKNLRREREKRLSDNFIAQLREKADIWIDWKLVDRLNSEQDYRGERSAIGHVNGKSIPIDDFLYDMKRAVQRESETFRNLKDKSQIEEKCKSLKEKITNRLVTYELIEQEALRRNYMKETDFMDMVKKQEKSLLVNAFKTKLVHPLAVPTEEELMQYYKEHMEEFKTGHEVWFREMRFEDRKSAKKILAELRQGADFEFLATRVSEDSVGKKGNVWVSTRHYSPPVREVLNRLDIGGISDVITDGKAYKIIKLKGRRGGEPAPFSKVREKLKNIVGKEKFKNVLSEYLSKLRKISDIKIHKDAIQEIEKKYSQNVMNVTSGIGSK